MTLKQNILFTPEAFITRPRRSSAIPNPSGTYAIFTVSKYSLESHSETKEVRILTISNHKETLFSDDDRNKGHQWLVDDRVLWLKDVDDGSTQLWIGNAGSEDKSAYLAGSIPARIANVKTKELPDGSIAVALTADAHPDGSLYNSSKAPKHFSSAREFDTVLVRFWDTYMKPEQSSLWYTTLQKVSHRYQLDEKNVINALKGTSLVCPIWPSDPLTGSCYDISANGLLVTAKDPQFNPAHLLISGLWYFRIDSFTESDSKLQFHKITGKGYRGSISAATFSSDGKKIAFLQQKEAGKETDWNRIFVIDNLKRLDLVVEISVQKGFFNKASWGLTPTSVVWSNESRDIYVTAEEKGNGKLFLIPVDLHHNSEDARAGAVTRVSVPLSEEGTVSSVYPLPSSKEETRLFVNKTTLTQDSIFTIILCPYTPTSIEISSEVSLHSSLGMSSSQVSEIIFKGHGNYLVQAWVIKPSNFNPNKKYPLALLIHGGPYGAWLNAWSTRWNPLIFAEQGYIVVAPNPTGSSGFGYEFAEAIKGDWGGACYHDLEECIDYVERKMPYVDTERMVALGASFGGYMVNWIAGQPLGKKFKALVCHDGIFSNYNMLASDIIAPLADDMGGTLWTHKERWDKFDPAQFTQNWTTPMLIIHSDLDYRCPITEGLAAFSVCQQKGIESRFLNFPDENHFVQKPENSLKWHRTVLGWINKYAKVEGGVVLEPPVSEPRRSTYQGA